MLENVVCGEVFEKRFLTDIVPEDIPAEQVTDYIMDAIDWDLNFEPDLKQKYLRPAVQLAQTQDGLTEKWVCYGNDFVSAKEVTVAPGRTVVLTDRAAYGAILVQGFGTFGAYRAEAVNLMRAGALTADEFFVGWNAARSGVTITNSSTTEPLVLLQHFGPDNCFYPQTT